jgi:Kef-type K+ transport system membrane component KefB
MTRVYVLLVADLLTFLACTVFTIPIFKRLKISPILGFLTAGVVLQQLE